MLFLSTILFGLSSNLSLSLVRPLPLSLIYGDSTQACRPDKNPTFLMMPNLFAAAARDSSFIYFFSFLTNIFRYIPASFPRSFYKKKKSRTVLFCCAGVNVLGRALPLRHRPRQRCSTLPRETWRVIRLESHSTI